jgi:FkbM family methyltransferase
MNLILPDDPDITGWFKDEAEIREAYWLVQAGDVVLDIGSHIGSYAIPALAAGATVYAVDPDAGRLAILARLCEINSLDMSRLVTVNEAVAGAGGYTQDFRSALDAAPYPEHHAPAAARFSTMDDLAGRLAITRLDWVKIDVEGAELGVLQGGQNILGSAHPALLIEDHTDVYPFVAQMNSRHQCTELLESLGYTIETNRYQDNLTPDRTFLICHPNTRKG